MEAILILLLAIGLVMVWLNARKRARNAVRQLTLDVAAAEESFASPGEGEASGLSCANVKALLAKASEALEHREWDKAEELCQLGYGLLAVALSGRQPSQETSSDDKR